MSLRAFQATEKSARAPEKAFNLNKDPTQSWGGEVSVWPHAEQGRLYLGGGKPFVSVLCG